MNMGQRSKKWARLKNGKPVNGVKYGSRPTVVSFPEFDKTKPSFLLNLPTELLMEIIGHVYSSRDLRSLQEAHPIFDEIVSSPSWAFPFVFQRLGRRLQVCCSRKLSG